MDGRSYYAVLPHDHAKSVLSEGLAATPEVYQRCFAYGSLKAWHLLPEAARAVFDDACEECAICGYTGPYRTMHARHARESSLATLQSGDVATARKLHDHFCRFGIMI